ncbi:MAG TPA: DNA gyrase subunit A, partial [Plesiomonas shigelloides]|nr:DNA gyrase subunit A [Plesiomonas shigelloides]
LIRTSEEEQVVGLQRILDADDDEESTEEGVELSEQGDEQAASGSAQDEPGEE